VNQLCLSRDTAAAQATKDFKARSASVIPVRNENLLTKNLDYAETDFFFIRNILVEVPCCSPEKESYCEAGNGKRC